MPTENRSSNTEMVSLPKVRAELQLLINLLAEVARTAHWLADNSEDCGDEGIDCQRVDFEALSDALDKCEELPELPDSVYVRDGWLRAADELRALLAQSAEQHQGEPVVLPARKHGIHADYSQNPLADGWNACLDEIAKLGPLYTHADPGEVERLRAELAEWKKRCQYSADTAHDVARERDTLRAQLATSDDARESLSAQLRAAHDKLAERDALLRDIASGYWELSIELPADLLARLQALSASAESEAKS